MTTPGQWRTPSARLRTARRLEVGAGTAVLAIVFGVLSGVVGSVAVGVGVAVAVLVVGGAVAVFVERRVLAWRYAEREDDLLVARGVLFQRLSIVPYGRMQFVDVTAGPVERSFGLATVRLHTAAAASDARIPGLPEAEAQRLRDALASLGEARAAGV